MPEKVLVVDDGQDIRDFLIEYILQPKGYRVAVATNGQEGLEKALAEKPDLMIVDNQMPKMSGIELLRELRQRQIEIPAILTTAFGSEETAVEAFRLGVRDYIIKPFDFSEINDSVEAALREGRLKRERDQLVRKVMESKAQIERRLQELNTLYSIGKSVSSSLDMEQVLHRVVEAAVFITNAEEGFLMLLDDDQGELYVRASKNLDSKTQSMRLRVQDSLAGRVMSTGQPIVMGDDERWQKIKTSYLARSLIYIPLILNDKPVGVLGVVNRVKQVLFDQRDTRVLSAMADYAAIAIRNAGLFSESEVERNKLGTILSQTGDPVLVVDEQGTLVLANEAAREVLEFPPGPFIGQPAQAFIKDKELYEFINPASSPEANRRGEITTDDDRVFNINMTPIDNVGRSIVMHDITQLKELDRLKSEFVSVVSHDLRSPLTTIRGYVELMERAGPLNETQKDFADRVQTSVTNITSLISDLLDLGRLEAGLDLTLTHCAPSEILLEIVEEVQSDLQLNKLEIDLDLEPMASYILGDHGRLRQAFSNLIRNAIKYTPEGGKISICSHAQDQQIIIEVADTGIGIAPSEQPYIFDRFYRADAVAQGFEGTGLGLSIVKSVVERHDGRIWVNSEINKGSTFTLVLPINDEPENS